MQKKLALIVAAWAAIAYTLQPRQPTITAAAKLALADAETGLRNRQAETAKDICVYINSRDGNYRPQPKVNGILYNILY